MTSIEAKEATVRKAVPIDRYAEILAHVVHFGSERTGDVVNRFGLSLEQWRVIDAAWTNLLGTPGQTHALALAFSSTFHARREKLAQEQPALGSLVVPQVHFPDKPERMAAAVAAKASGVPSFMSGASPAPSMTASVSPWAAYSASPGTPTATAGSLGATKAIDDNDISAIARQITPFEGMPTRSEGRPTRDPELTLEQHASLHVELEMHPEDAAEILGRYGLTTAQHARIDMGWEAQIALNPKVAAAWRQAIEQYRAWVSSNQAR